MKKRSLFLLGIFCLPFLSVAQTEQSTVSVINTPNVVNQISRGSAVYVKKAKKPEGVIGSVYLNPNWEQGTIKTSKNALKQIPVRYNIYVDEIEFEYKNDLRAVHKDKVQYVEIQTQKFIFVNLKKGEKTTKGYVEVLSEGNLNLFLRREQVIQKSDYNKLLDIGDERNRLVTVETIFVQKKEDTEAIFVKKTKKDILRLMGEHSKTVENFAKKQKLKFNKDADLIAIFDFYNKQYQ